MNSNNSATKQQSDDRWSFSTLATKPVHDNVTDETPDTRSSAIPTDSYAEQSTTKQDAHRFDDVMKRIGGNVQLLQRLVELFAVTGPQYLHQIDAAIAAGDANTLTISAHSLKGATANLGGMRASEACRQLEMTARGGDLRDAGPLQQHVQLEVAALEAELRVFLKSLECSQ